MAKLDDLNVENNWQIGLEYQVNIIITLKKEKKLKQTKILAKRKSKRKTKVNKYYQHSLSNY